MGGHYSLFQVVIALIVTIGFPFAIIYNIIFYSRLKKIQTSIKKFERGINNEKARNYIKLIRKSRIPNHPHIYSSLRAGFSLVNNSNEVSYELKEELMNVLLSKSVSLGNARIRRNKREIENEIIESGKTGEENVRHQLEFLKLEGYKILHNIKIPNPVHTQEIDHIVVGQNGLFHIETKNHKGSGKISIDTNGNWIIDKDGRENVIKNPVGQVDRHETVIKHYINKEFPNINIPIVGMVALANENIALEGQENCPVPVKNSEELTFFIKSRKSDVILSKENIEEIYKNLSRFSNNTSAAVN